MNLFELLYKLTYQFEGNTIIEHLSYCDKTLTSDIEFTIYDDKFKLTTSINRDVYLIDRITLVTYVCKTFEEAFNFIYKLELNKLGYEEI